MTRLLDQVNWFMQHVMSLLVIVGYVLVFYWVFGYGIGLSVGLYDAVLGLVLIRLGEFGRHAP